jgi:two-component system cell cycle sensor histidine kinase/response regulator CckA
LTPSSSNGSGPETILVVEDATHVRKLVQKILEDADFEVLTAAGGAEAVQLAAEYPRKIDLLLTDVLMPEISGPELAKKLKELRPEMKIMLMSGYADGMLILNYGWYFVQKPFIPAALVGRVKDILKSSRLADQGTDHFDTRL